MELTTLTKGFLKNDVIDDYGSVIWTERYYGDSEVQIVAAATPENIQKLAVGKFLSQKDSDEVMILETHDIQDYKVTVSGISLLSWLNNRFIRRTAAHADRYWNIEGIPAGHVLWNIIQVMCTNNVFYPAGVPNPADFEIKNLTAAIPMIDISGPAITVAVPYGPVYDALKTIATTYQVGMTITLDSATETTYALGFRSYRGVDRTSDQTVNPVIRFSPQMDSFTNIKELQSQANYKTRVYTYAPGAPTALTGAAGFAGVSNPGTPATDFDLRAAMVFAEDITTDQIGGSAPVLLNILNQRATDALETYKFTKFVDGEIVPTSQFQYGVDYNLGDVIEVQGHSGIIQHARITEYIRSQDSAGEKAYPTVEMID